MKVNKSLIKDFIKDYNNGLSTIKIGKKYDVSYTTVYNYLKKSNVKIRSASERGRKYEILEDFFDKIDTQEKAYFLGILYADGCNSTEVNTVRITLTEKDKDILKKLSSLIYPNNDRPLGFQPGRINTFNEKQFRSRNSYVLRINNKKISQRLEMLGVTKAKTSTITFPSFLNNDLVPHFIRGYFDGDGSVSFRKSGQVILSMIGTKKFCKSIQKIVKQNLNINSTICHAKKGSPMDQFALHGNRVGIKFLNWVYKDAIIYLNRKYNKYIEIKNTIPMRYDNCTICDDKHFGKGYCKYHYYEYIGREKRRKRYLISKNL